MPAFNDLFDGLPTQVLAQGRVWERIKTEHVNRVHPENDWVTRMVFATGTGPRRRVAVQLSDEELHEGGTTYANTMIIWAIENAT